MSSLRLYLSNTLKLVKNKIPKINKIRYASSYSEDKSTHFGYETVSEKDKADKVYGVFENVASNYDLMNDAMSLGIHRLWKDCFVSRLSPVPGTRLLDVAGGTGDIAFRFIDYINNLVQDEKGYVSSLGKLYHSSEPTGEDNSESSDPLSSKGQSTHAIVCDINEAMLEVGKERALRQGYNESVSWVKGDAEKLPFESNLFDAYTIAFGIRNVVHIEKALAEAHRVLKPGGRFMCLEFSHVRNPVLADIYDLYSFQVIPVLGKVIAKDWKSYQYLVESIRLFPKQEEFKKMIEDTGFNFVTYENLTFGVCAIHSGFKI